MMELKLRQAAFADMLILNKVHRVTPEEIGGSRPGSTTVHRYRLVEHPAAMRPWTSWCRSAGLIPPDSMAHRHRTSPLLLLTVRIPLVGSTCMAMGTTTRRPSGRGATKRQRRFPGSAAGHGAPAPGQRVPLQRRVHTAEAPGRRVILQVVGKRVDIAVGNAWRAENHGTGSSPSAPTMA